MTIIEADHNHHEPPSFELDQVDMYGKYMLSSRLDILFVLRAMLKHGCMATVYFDHGKSFFLTTLLAVNEENNSLTIDVGSDPVTNRAAGEASSLIVTASLERVKIQFLLAGLHPVTFEGNPAFRAALPAHVLRLQRREYFRLETPVANPIHCQITIGGEEGSTRAHSLPLLDISGGGVGLMADNQLAPLCKVGTLLLNSRFELPEEGVVSATLCVRSAFGVTTRNGHTFTRLGCEFVNLPGTRLTMIQRYITRIERERKARLAGLE